MLILCAKIKSTIELLGSNFRRFNILERWSGRGLLDAQRLLRLNARHVGCISGCSYLGIQSKTDTD